MKFCLLLLALVPLWAQTVSVASTTTTADVSTTASRVPIANNAGITAGMVCSLEREIMDVISFDPPGTTGARTMTVKRSKGGIQTAHLSGAPMQCGDTRWFHTSDAAGSCATNDVAWINTITGEAWQCVNRQWVKSGIETKCNAASRGRMVFTPATPSSKSMADMLRICALQVDGTYLWMALF